MTKPITIPKELPQDSSLSYEFLYDEGIKLIQKLAGNTWTDHNIHDPGITILEQLCYAITDLAYRIDHDIPDLLGVDNGSSYAALFSAANIFTMNPVTLLDLRKVVIDVHGVKNAWIEKLPSGIDPGIPKGLYRVVIEKDDWVDITGSEVLNKVKQKLHAIRNICEDFDEVVLLSPQEVRLQGNILISDTVDDINEFIASVLFRVNNYLSPRIPFYTLRQMEERGMRVDEIFDGPRLLHGFIDNEALIKHKRIREVQASDIIREIMDEPHALAVDDLLLVSGANTVKEWLLPIDPIKTPQLDILGSLNGLIFTSQGLKVSFDRDQVMKLYNEKNGASLLQRILRPEELDISLPESKKRNLSQYFSIQDHFPASYGIGTPGLPESVSDQRKGQSKQLIAYLVFFEQFLTNYFSQVAHFRDLVSFDGEDVRTYFPQSLLDSIPTLGEILESKEGYLNYLEEGSISKVNLRRKNQFLNHLLARFGEQFTSYELLKDTSRDYDFVMRKLIKDKADFLREYPAISGGRAKGYDYTQTHWQTSNISGLEKRIARKLGINDYTRRNLADGDSEGFHMVEHILLRPHEKERYPFEEHYVPGVITAFEASEKESFTKCISTGHSLQEGDQIRIQGPTGYEGVHTVSSIEEESFEIETTFVETTDEATWRRTQPDLRYAILTEPIITFAQSAASGRTFCEIGEHDLKDGASIEIVGTQHYDGEFSITGITENGFEIDKAFQEEEHTGRWMLKDMPYDPYSFQLTFIIPTWMERYQNEESKKLMEQILREETPVHLNVHMKMLNQQDMELFEKVLQQFLADLNHR